MCLRPRAESARVAIEGPLTSLPPGDDSKPQGVERRRVQHHPSPVDHFSDAGTLSANQTGGPWPHRRKHEPEGDDQQQRYQAEHGDRHPLGALLRYVVDAHEGLRNQHEGNSETGPDQHGEGDGGHRQTRSRQAWVRIGLAPNCRCRLPEDDQHGGNSEGHGAVEVELVDVEPDTPFGKPEAMSKVTHPSTRTARTGRRGPSTTEHGVFRQNWSTTGARS